MQSFAGHQTMVGGAVLPQCSQRATRTPAAAAFGAVQKQRAFAQRTTAQKQQRSSRLRCEATATAGASATGNRLTAAMQAAAARNQVALIPFVCAGDPNLDTTAKALRILDEVGVDIIELGVPYSDPLADGPVIQAAATRALNAGTTLDKVIELVKEVSPNMKAPLVLFTYYNPILRRGTETFIREIAAAGASGLLIPDIPLEETEEARGIAARYGIELVLLATPTTSEDRMRKIALATSGFVYLVSVTGVTGVQDTLQTRVKGLVEMLKGVTDKPVAVGFGVSRGEQAAQLATWGADGVIVGSALVRALGDAATPEEGLERFRTLASELRAALPARELSFWEKLMSGKLF